MEPSEQTEPRDEGSPAATTPAFRLPRSWPLWLALLLTLLSYLPALGNGFTMDDRFVAIAQNDQTVHPLIQELHAPSRYFARHYWADYTEYSPLYRPVTVLSYAIRHALFGDSALAAHLANLALHLLAVWMTYLLVRGLGGNPLVAGLGAAVFGLHAIRSEVVASVVGRAELLGFCFGAGALLLLLRSRPWTAYPRIAAHMGGAMLLFLAFCSKESSVAWLPFIVLYDLLQRRILLPQSPLFPPIRIKRIADAVILLVPLVCFLFLRHRALGPSPEFDTTVNALVNPLYDLRFDLRLLNATVVWGYALLLTLFPFELTVDYGAAVFPIARSWADPVTILFVLSLASLGGLLYVGLAWFRRAPLLAAGALSFLGFSFLTSNILFPIGTIFGERLMYTPALGLCFCAAWGVRALLRRSDVRAVQLRPAVLVILGIWIGGNWVQIQNRIPIWSENRQLFTHESLANPNSARMRFCLAGVQRQDGQLEASAQTIQAGLELCPQHVPGWNKLGRIRFEQGRGAEAVRVLERGLTLIRKKTAQLRPMLYGNLALSLALLGQESRARAALSACKNAGRAYFRSQRDLLRLEAQLGSGMSTPPEFGAAPDRR